MDTIIFTDGAARGNPGRAGWGAIILHDKEVVEIGGGSDHATNNQMELTAAIEAFKAVGRLSKISEKVLVYIDSQYVINGITKWVYGWQKNNWITTQKEPVSNKELWQELVELVRGKKIEWKYVGGHSGIAGNERCDEIATAFADKNNPELYRGALDAYSHDLLTLTVNEEKASKKSDARRRSSQPAFSYLSLVDGVLARHKTWTECESRVKGKKGARFKKALSSGDEDSILAEWGVRK